MNRQQKRAKRMKAREAQKRHRRTKVEQHGRHAIEVQGGPKPTPSFHKTDPPKHGRRLDAHDLAVAELGELGIVNPDPQLIAEYQRLKRAHKGSAALAKADVKKAVDAMNKGLRKATKAVKDIQAAQPGEQVVADESGTRIEPKPNVGTEVKLPSTDSGQAANLAEICADLGGYSAENQRAFMRGDFSAAAPEDVGHIKNALGLDSDATWSNDNGEPTDAEWAELEATAKKRRRGAKGYEKVLSDAGFELVGGGDPKTRTDWRRAA